MVDLSKKEDHSVYDSTPGLSSLEVFEKTGDGQTLKYDVTGSTNLSDYTGASIRVLEGIEAIRFALQCISGTPINMVCIT